MKLKPCSYIVIIVARLILCQGQSACIPVEPCTVAINENQIGGLVYEVSSDTNLNFICPRTDVSQWVIRAVVSSTNSSTVDDGTFCGVNITFNSSLVCSTGTGRLAFQNPDKFQNDNGLFTFNFNSSMYNITIPIKYAKPGVFPRQSVVQIIEDKTISLDFFVYSSTSVANFILSRDGTVLYQNIGMPQSSDVTHSPNIFECLEAETERTDVLEFQIANPIAGSYTLEYGIYTATITVVNSVVSTSFSSFVVISPSSSIDISTTISLTIDPSSIIPSITDSMSKSTSIFPTDPSPTSQSPSPSPNNQIAAIIGGIIGGSVLMVACGIIWIIPIICCLCKAERVKREELVPGAEEPLEDGLRLNSVGKNPLEIEEPDSKKAEELVGHPSPSVNGTSTPRHKHVVNGGVAKEESQTSPNIETPNGSVAHKAPVDHEKNGKYKMATLAETQLTQSHPSSPATATRGDQQCLPTPRTQSTPPSPQLVHYQAHEGNFSKEFLDIEKKRLKLEQESLEERKKQTNILSEIRDNTKTAITTQINHHEENKELKKEHIEVDREILGIVETNTVNEVDSDEPRNTTSTDTTEPLTATLIHQPHSPHTTDSNNEFCNNLGDSSSPDESNTPLSDANDCNAYNND